MHTCRQASNLNFCSLRLLLHLTTQTCNQSPVTSQSLTAHGVFCQLQQPLPTRKHLVNKQKQQNDAPKFDKCEQDANEPEKMTILRRRVLR